MKTEKIVITITVGIACLILVMIMFMQFKVTKQIDIASIETMTDSELRSELVDIKERYEQLNLQYSETLIKLQEYKEEYKTDEETREILQKELYQLQTILGITAVEGQGIIITIREDNLELENDRLISLVEEKLKFPVFVKPSNSGSSIGITKAKNGAELIKAIEEAAIYDKKILIEETIVGKEVECAVLGNEASTVGQILPAEEFYSFDAKYENAESKVVIPADLSDEKMPIILDEAFAYYDTERLQNILRCSLLLP